MIKLENLSKTFTQKNGQSMQAVNDVNLHVEEGKICVLLGPSGCGKTTTLKMVNRLITPTSGRILINGQDTQEMDVVALRRQIGYVIQQIGLFPNMTIEENICIVPRLLGWDKKKSRERARELMDMVALDPKRFLSRYPREMSGGQQQRIGVIRALAADAPVLLMDEPFGAVDPINRESIDVYKRQLAVLALAMVLVGIGDQPAVIALFLASLLPIVRNTYTGLCGVSPALLEAAKGLGMTPRQSLWYVELPNAAPVILVGVRMAMVINVGTVPLTFLIGASSYGELIFPGIFLNNQTQLLVGAGATAIVALALDQAIAGLGRVFARRAAN